MNLKLPFSAVFADRNSRDPLGALAVIATGAPGTGGSIVPVKVSEVPSDMFAETGCMLILVVILSTMICTGEDVAELCKVSPFQKTEMMYAPDEVGSQS